MMHPYKGAPARSFWSRSISRNWSPTEAVDSIDPLIRRGDKVVSAGSCFASNMVPYLEEAGLTYYRTETAHPAFRSLEPEYLGYAKFSAAYGNIYTARQLLQLLKRCLGSFSPAEDRWVVEGEIIDSLRPGLKYRARSNREFDLLTAQHLRKTHEAFSNADVFVFTLGLTEAWISRQDGTVFSACPGTVAGSFDPDKHEFKNFTVSDTVADLSEFANLIRDINPGVRIILTVSPVPLVATATGRHVLNASTYSKSVLRAAAGEIVERFSNTTYFPAYEIVTGPQAPEEFFEKDRRNVSETAVGAVMKALLAHCDLGTEVAKPLEHQSIIAGDAASQLSQFIAASECEEAMADLQGDSEKIL
jgi:hypothetical protein